MRHDDALAMLAQLATSIVLLILISGFLAFDNKISEEIKVLFEPSPAKSSSSATGQQLKRQQQQQFSLSIQGRKVH